MNPADLPRQLQDARQLARLRQLRERAALAALREAERACAQAQEAIDARKAVFARLQRERDALGQRIVNDCVPEMGRLAAYAGAAVEALDDQIERTEYALMDDEDALAQAREKQAQAHQAWQRAVAATGAANTLVDDTRKAQRQMQETMQEREAEDTARPAHTRIIP